MVFLIIVIASDQIAAQQIRLPAIFGDHMVLQRGKPISIWGWASAGETVRVKMGKNTRKAKAGADGLWEINLPAMAAGGPHQISISGQETVILSDILVGDVWVCGGQSNMEWTFHQLQPAYQDMVAKANYSGIRLLTVERAYSFSPQDDFLTDGWKVSSPANVKEFSAVAFFFGRAINGQVQVPVGLISSNWGGTPARPWISRRKLPITNTPQKQEAILQKGLAQIGNKVITRTEFNSVFREKMSDLDRQYRHNRPWSQGNIDTTDWQLMPKTGRWENNLLPGYDGIVWMYKTIDIPTKQAGKPLWLNLGVVDDADSTWFNGYPVGSLDHRFFYRNYMIPGRLVKPGENKIVVKVLDRAGPGGLLSEGRHLFIASQKGDSRISLSENWYIRSTVSSGAVAPSLGHHRPTGQLSLLFNAMIAPLTRVPVKGIIWYQGESNRGRPAGYRQTLTALIEDWRLWWGQPRLPFFIVQLANYLQPQENPSESNLALIREAQLRVSQTVPGTGLAVTIDIGDADDIHPKNKKDVGERLALAARHMAYKEAIIHSGPVFKHMEITGDTIRLSFEHIGSGLMIKGPAQNPQEFAIAGKNRKFYRAKAEIRGDGIIVYSPKVENPVAVRYAWADNPEHANLYNKEGLPASPFRTDSWESTISN